MMVGYIVKVSAPFKNVDLASSYNNSYLRVIKNGQLPMVSILITRPKSRYFRLVIYVELNESPFAVSHRHLSNSQTSASSLLLREVSKKKVRTAGRRSVT
jgi:hypothetical protein